MGALIPFKYFEPKTVTEAAQILMHHGVKAKVLAGGVNLVPGMRKRDIQPECVVSLHRIPDLDFIEDYKTNELRIGALTKLRSIELSPKIQKDYIALYESIHQISTIQVKTMGTAVGNLCVATPSSDVATSLAVLSAKLKISSTTSARDVPIEDFYIGLNHTILQPGELVTDILLPKPLPNSGSAFVNLRRTADDISKVCVAVLVTVANDTIKEARIALGAVAPTVIRARAAEKVLVGQKTKSTVIKQAAEAAEAEAKPITDIRSTNEYRKEMVALLTIRAIEKALGRVSFEKGRVIK